MLSSDAMIGEVRNLECGLRKFGKIRIVRITCQSKGASLGAPSSLGPIGIALY